MESSSEIYAIGSCARPSESPRALRFYEYELAHRANGAALALLFGRDRAAELDPARNASAQPHEIRELPTLCIGDHRQTHGA